ncbi:MAG: hypothetical protein WAT61_13715 [Flavobacteriales bacterium]|jgi:xanthine/uracil/vitamin C permease (AzgA family)
MKITGNKILVRRTLIAVLLLFGAITLFLSTSIFFDLFGMREKEGNFVPFVVQANFIASIGYVAAAIGLIAHKPWARYPLWMASVVLLVASIAFAWYVYQGGIHEQRTIGALAFRTLLTLAFYATAVWIGRGLPQQVVPDAERS